MTDKDIASHVNIEVYRVQILEMLDEYQSSKGLSTNALKIPGVSSATLSQLRNAKYPNPFTALTKIQAFLEKEAKRRTYSVGFEYVSTSQGAAIIEELEQVQYAHAHILVIYGGPGIGKTSTIRHYAARANSGCVFIDCNPTLRTQRWFLNKLCDELAIPRGKSDSVKFDRIIDKCKAEKTTIILDDAQVLAAPDKENKVLEIVRKLSDGGVRFVLCGNNDLPLGAASRHRTEFFHQLGSRITKLAVQDDFDIADVRALAKHYLGEALDRKVVQFLHASCNRLVGSLRIVTIVLQKLAYAKKRHGHEPSVERVAAVLDRLITVEKPKARPREGGEPAKEEQEVKPLKAVSA